MNLSANVEGVLLVDKPIGKTSFSLVAVLRRLLKVQKIGHGGTLDPFASGLMVMLIGKKWTRQASYFLTGDKSYEATLYLGKTTDTYDREGVILATSSQIPSLEQVEAAIAHFQGTIEQIPPMYSAKKYRGKKLYELARKGQEIVRSPVACEITIQLLTYSYPDLQIRVHCSKGTYIRSLAHDIGLYLQCGAHLTQLQRTQSGPFLLAHSLPGSLLYAPATTAASILPYIRHMSIRSS